MKTRDKYKLYKPKKFLGQNFLVDDNISRKIVKQLDLKDTDTVLEIGPGQGALTKHLAGFCKNYIAIEIDKNIAESLKEKYENKVKIINEDFLKYNLSQFKKPIKIIGNLPYNIASEILFKLFDHREKIECAVLMVQKEFARRLVASPNSKEYGIMSVQTQVFCKPGILFNVPATVFFPKPKVESSVIKLNFCNDNYNILNRDSFKLLVRAAFGKRRKTLKNSLKNLFEELKLDFNEYDLFFDFSKRAENIGVADYVQLANQIFVNVF
ncbi:MAG: 16S rRNA (adenine(1518)-N(6)/adenine(1519)-N(6))-dimethyltransferase RsmA [Ignavibacteriae bacterium]|nr:16S rRNA (adenine(1518)-N(6)/adenine(1519)-N(6))-dimethyltransferase RsmA [Ignavibacteriota bacterium]